MHELSLVEGIVRIIEGERKKHRFSRVREIEIVCGPYNCLSEECLQFCIEAMAGSSCVRGARLRVKRTKDARGENSHIIYLNRLEVE